MSQLPLESFHQSNYLRLLCFAVFHLQKLDRSKLAATLSILWWLKAFDEQDLHSNDQHVERVRSHCVQVQGARLTNRKHTEPREPVPSAIESVDRVLPEPDPQGLLGGSPHVDDSSPIVVLALEHQGAGRADTDVVAAVDAGGVGDGGSPLGRDAGAEAATGDGEEDRRRGDLLPAPLAAGGWIAAVVLRRGPCRGELPLAPRLR